MNINSKFQELTNRLDVIEQENQKLLAEKKEIYNQIEELKLAKQDDLFLLAIAITRIFYDPDKDLITAIGMHRDENQFILQFDSLENLVKLDNYINLVTKYDL